MPSGNFLVHTQTLLLPGLACPEAFILPQREQGQEDHPAILQIRGRVVWEEAALASQLAKTSYITAHDAGVREDPQGTQWGGENGGLTLRPAPSHHLSLEQPKQQAEGWASSLILPMPRSLSTLELGRAIFTLVNRLGEGVLAHLMAKINASNAAMSECEKHHEQMKAGWSLQALSYRPALTLYTHMFYWSHWRADSRPTVEWLAVFP